MNQPPGGGYPPGPPYPGQPGSPQQGYPQQPHQGYPQQQAQPSPVGQPGAAKPFMGTALMPGAPAIPGMNPAQDAQAQAAAALAAQQQYGGAPQQQQQYGGAPPQQQYGGAPPQTYGQAAVQGGYDPNAQPQGGYGGAPGAQPQQPYGQPPGGYPGAPQQGGPMQGQAPQQQQQGIVPQFGVGGFGPGGMPRLNISGGMSPSNLLGAVISGQGFAKPRLTGLGMIALSMVFGIANTVLVLVLHRYYGYLYSAGAILGWAGTFMLITGQPKQQADGSKAPGWARIGLYICFGIGVCVGVALSVLPFESWLFNAAVGQ